MEMGTGKSRTAIDIAVRRWGRVRRVVWFCPVSLVETIRREIHKHIEGATVHAFDDRTSTSRLPVASWYVVGIESMSSSRRVQLAAAHLVDASTLCIVDESGYIKNPHAIRTDWITRVGDRAGWRLILTGTPITLGVVDLFAQMRFLSPEILGYRSFYSFAANHLEYEVKKVGGRNVHTGRIVRAHNIDFLTAKIAPYAYQVTKDECLTLPERLYVERWARMTTAQRDLYETVKSRLFDEMNAWGDVFDSTLIYRLFGALQQAACGFWREYPPYRPDRPRAVRELVTEHRVDHNRLAMLESVLHEIPDADKVVLWCKWRSEIPRIVEMLEREFPGAGVSQFQGDMKLRERAASVDAFRSANRFFVATPQSGGHGLTLNEAPYAVFYTSDFNLAHEDQAEARNHRIGQERSVTYIKIGVSGTIDERIARNLATKGAVARDFARAVKAARSNTDRRKLMETFFSGEGAEDEVRHG